MAVKINDVIVFLESLAPRSLQENYDNCGLLVGSVKDYCTGVLVCLDSLEAIVDEAIEKHCNLIVAHHPIVFAGLKSLTGKNYIERVVIKAVQNNIAIYAIHTNLDNVLEGVNGVMGQALGLSSVRVLLPKKNELRKIAVYVPMSHEENLKNALFSAGAGHIGNYDECSFSVSGVGTFRAGQMARPYVGEIEKRHHEEEVKIEVVFPVYKEKEVISTMEKAHPYEEVAYDLYDVHNVSSKIGAGIIGELPHEMALTDFLLKVKDTFSVKMLRYTGGDSISVKRVAYCGGSGSFLLSAAMAMKADVYVTADVKYHQFFDAEDKICLVDIGHYESEYLIIKYLVDKLKEKFTTFAVLLTNVNTNPINFL
jgi:dinuclear metal center YbgI/SA1388 family protein